MQRQQAYLQTGLLQQRAGDVDVVPLWHKGSLGGVRAIVHAVDAWWVGHVKHNSTHQTSQWEQNDKRSTPQSAQPVPERKGVLSGAVRATTQVLPWAVTARIFT